MGDLCGVKRLYTVVPVTDLELLFKLLPVKEVTRLPNVLSSQEDVFMPVVTMCVELLFVSLPNFPTSLSSPEAESSKPKTSRSSESLNSNVSLLIVCRVTDVDMLASIAVECRGPNSDAGAILGDDFFFNSGAVITVRDVDRNDRRESCCTGDGRSRGILSDCDSGRGCCFPGMCLFAAVVVFGAAEDALARLRVEPRSADSPPPPAGGAGASSPLSSELNPSNFLLANRRLGVLAVAFWFPRRDFSFLRYNGRVVSVIGPTLTSPRAANSFLSSLSVSRSAMS